MAKQKKINTTPTSILLGYKPKTTNYEMVSNNTTEDNIIESTNSAVETISIEETNCDINSSINDTNDINSTNNTSDMISTENIININNTNNTNNTIDTIDTNNTIYTNDTNDTNDNDCIENEIKDNMIDNIDVDDSDEDNEKYFTSSIRYETDIYDALRILKNFEKRKSSSINSLVNKILREYISLEENAKKIEAYKTIFNSIK